LIQLFDDALPYIKKANGNKNFLFEIDREDFYLAEDK